MAPSCPPGTTRWPCLRCCAPNRATSPPDGGRNWNASPPPAAPRKTSPGRGTISTIISCRGRRAELDLFPAACRTVEDFSGMVHNLFDHLLPRAQTEETGRALSLEALLETHGFDRVQHEQIQADLNSGRIGLAQNRLPVTSHIEDAAPDELDARHRALGMQALA